MRKLLVAVLTVAALVLLLAVPASATPPTHVSGTWGTPGGVPGTRTTTQVGPQTCVLDGDWYMGWAGDMSGTGQAHIQIVSHGPCVDEDGMPYPKGSFMENLHYTGTFEGIVLGREGSFEFVQAVKFTPVDGGTPEAPFFDGDGKMVILSGTGELEGMRGTLTLRGRIRDGPPMVTYDGEIHFDPQ